MQPLVCNEKEKVIFKKTANIVLNILITDILFALRNKTAK